MNFFSTHIYEHNFLAAILHHLHTLMNPAIFCHAQKLMHLGF
jgi:hypothetical protein